MAWFDSPLAFSFTVNPSTAAISVCSPFSMGVSLIAFQYSPSTKTLPPRELIGVNAVTVRPISVSAPTFTGKNCARCGQFADDPVDRDEHENEHDLGPPQLLKDTFGGRHLDLRHLGAGSLKRLAIHYTAVQLF